MSSPATIVHDASEAVPLCAQLGLYLKPIARVTIAVSLPPLRPPGRSVSNWEVMERLRALAQAARAPFATLRIARSSLDSVRLEGELENRAAVRAALARLDGRTIRLAGFADGLRVRAAEARADFPSRHDWDAFFRDAPDMDEALPGERPDTVHLEGLPCRWFADRGPGVAAAAAGSTSGAGPSMTAPVTSSSMTSAAASVTSTSSATSTVTSSVTSQPGTSAMSSGTLGVAAVTTSSSPVTLTSSVMSSSMTASGAWPGSSPERPSEAVLRQAFSAFGEIRRVDIPMLDPYRAEVDAAGGRGFHTFSFGGQLQFEAYVQYREYAGFARAMAALRGMKLMFKGEDGKAVACGIKVSFDSTKHLSDASIRRRQLERQKLRELELQREEQKRREREAEERQRMEERKQREAEEQERERRREEKLRRREQRARAREERRSRRRVEKLQAEEQRRLQEKIRAEERRLLLAQRNLQSVRLVAELLARAEAARLRERAQTEEAELRRRRHQQEAELRRVEAEKRRALGLQRRERELRQRLVSLLLARRPDPGDPGNDTAPRARAEDDLLRPVLDMLWRGGAGGGAGAGRHSIQKGSDVIQAGSVFPDTGSGVAETGSNGTRTGSDVIGAGSDPAEAGKGPDAPPRRDKCSRDLEVGPEGEGGAEQAEGRGLRGRREPRPPRKPRDGGGAEEEEEAEPLGGSRERRRAREAEKDRGRDRKRGRHHREEERGGRGGESRSRSPRRRPAWTGACSPVSPRRPPTKDPGDSSA